MTGRRVIVQYPVMRVNRLPPLPEVVPLFAGLPKGDLTLGTLTTELRRLARRLRADRPRPFYSIRDVAAFFGAPHMTVARAFARLEEDGLLVRRRSTGTWLRGRTAHPRAPVHGVVAIPIFTYGFSVLVDWRLFLRFFEEELWRRHFAPDLVFFRVYEETRPDFVARLLQRQPDIVVALQPIPESVPQLRSVADHGVQVVVLSEEFHPLPWPQYLLSWERALTRGLAEWRRAGLTAVSVLCKPGTTAQSAAVLRPLLKSGRFTVDYVEIDSERTAARQIRRLPRAPNHGYLVYEAYAASNLCGRAETEMARLIHDTRYLSCRHINIPPQHLGDVLVDLAVPDWRQVARTIAHDIARGNLSAPGSRILPAHWRPRVRAADFAQDF